MVIIMKVEEPIIIPRKLYVPGRTIVKEGNRYKIYLPKSMNKLWNTIRSRKVDVYIVIVDEGVD